MIFVYILIFILGVWVGGFAARGGLRRHHHSHFAPPEPLPVHKEEPKKEPLVKEAPPKKEELKKEAPKKEEPKKEPKKSEEKTIELEEPVSRQKDKKEANKNIILQVLEGNTEGITEEDAERLLGVSDATVEKYMEELEKEGKINKIESPDEPTMYKKTVEN